MRHNLESINYALTYAPITYANMLFIGNRVCVIRAVVVAVEILETRFLTVVRALLLLL